MLIENPIAFIDRNDERHHVRDIAEAFVAFLYSEDAQRAFAEFAFRPTNQAVTQAFATTFVYPPDLFTIAELGGWDNVFASLFSPQGSWARAVEDLTRAQ